MVFHKRGGGGREGKRLTLTCGCWRWGGERQVGGTWEGGGGLGGCGRRWSWGRRWRSWRRLPPPRTQAPAGSHPGAPPAPPTPLSSFPSSIRIRSTDPCQTKKKERRRNQRRGCGGERVELWRLVPSPLRSQVLMTLQSTAAAVQKGDSHETTARYWAKPSLRPTTSMAWRPGLNTKS